MKKGSKHKKETKILRDLQKEYKGFFKEARVKIRRTKESIAIKKEIIADLRKCNDIDLMYFLAKDANITSKQSFIENVNAFLSLEYETNKEYYNLTPEYKIGDMWALTEFVRLTNLKIDKINEQSNIGIKTA